jgi:hypothetical protein
MCRYTRNRKVNCELLEFRLAPDINIIFFFLSFTFDAEAPKCVRASSFTRFLDHTKRRTTLGRTPLDEWSARSRGPYLTKHNTHNRQISLPLAGFEPAIPASDRPQIHALRLRHTDRGQPPRLAARNLSSSILHHQWQTESGLASAAGGWPLVSLQFCVWRQFVHAACSRSNRKIDLPSEKQRFDVELHLFSR